MNTAVRLDIVYQDCQGSLAQKDTCVCCDDRLVTEYCLEEERCSRDRQTRRLEDVLILEYEMPQCLGVVDGQHTTLEEVIHHMNRTQTRL